MNIKFLPLLCLLSLSLSLFSCGRKKEAPSSPHAKKTILVSIAPYQTIVEKIAGDAFSVRTVVPPGANPHVYEPTARQIFSIQDGAVWFRIGESFEDRLLSALKEKNPNLTATDLREKIDIIHPHSEKSCSHCSNELGDPHIWLSPKLLTVQVQTIAGVLSQKFPDEKDLFEKNAHGLIQEFEELDREIRAILSGSLVKTFAVSHSAFAYFCKDYKLSQLSVEFGGKDPTLLYLANIMKDIGTDNVKLGIAMPQHSNKGLEIIAKKTAMHIHKIDPYSPDISGTLKSLAYLIAETK